MTGKKQKKGKRKLTVGAETSESIAHQTEAFINAGGVVEIVKRGVSGREPTLGRTHITIFPKK